jgi:hypothetical protein
MKNGQNPSYNQDMDKTLNILLVVGFLVVDWLIFHDIFKGGETYTVTEFLTGALSLLVFFTSGKSLLKK